MILTQALSGGGAERLAANLSLGLKNKANLYIVTYWKSEKEYDIAGKRINLNLLGKGMFGKLLCAIKRIRRVRALKKKYQIDYTLSFVPPCDYVNVMSRVRGEKILIDVVSNMSIAFPKGILKQFRKWVLGKADYIVTVSEGVRKDLADNFGIKENKSKTIYNSCDFKAIEKECKEKKQGKKESIDLPARFIVSAGSFRYPKGHWHLIKAFYTIKDEIPDIDLVLLGDGTYKGRYEALIKALGMEDRVRMPGFVNPPYGVLAKGELFVFSSVYEGFGNVLIEAMACGIPIVSVDCKYGPREILAPGTSLKHSCSKMELCEYGILSPRFGLGDINITRSVEAEELLLGKAIAEMLRRDELRKGYARKGKDYCKKFDNNSITQQWIAVMDMVNGL